VQWLFVDTPPSHEDPRSVEMAIAVADLVLIPVRPSPDDLEAVGPTIGLASPEARKTVRVRRDAGASTCIVGGRHGGGIVRAWTSGVCHCRYAHSVQRCAHQRAYSERTRPQKQGGSRDRRPLGFRASPVPSNPESTEAQADHRHGMRMIMTTGTTKKARISASNVQVPPTPPTAPALTNSTPVPPAAITSEPVKLDQKRATLNFTVTEGFKREYKVWCAAHGISLVDALKESFALLKAKHEASMP
jgi:hypothetical protein